MDLLSDLTVLSIVIFHTCNSLPVEGQSRTDILTDAFDNNLFKYYFLNVVNNNKSVERLSDLTLFDDLTNNIINDVPSPTEFRFEKTQYEINAHTGFVGILGHFCVVTNETSQIVYGLSSDDVYINKVFRLGPDSGILYADSSINIGDYKFNITADVSRKQLHAVAEVNVKITKSLTENNDNDDDDDVILKVRNFRFTLTGIRIFNDDSTNQQALTLTENIPESDNDGQGDVNTNDIVLPSRLKLWQKFLKKGFSSGLQYSDIKDLLLVRSQPPSEQERNRVLFPLLSTNSRQKRAISPKHFSTAPNAVNAAPSPNTVQSKRIYQESPLADTIMSTFVIFVVSFATIFFFGSIFYFAYKRIKKCGDYEVDEDAKSTTKPVDDETVYSTVQSDMKNPNILSISDISQKRVVDSIEITKQKLNGPASVFTIQRSYEQNALQHNGDGDLFVLDVEHKSNSASTPTITFTLINDQENFPQSTPTNDDCNGDAVKETSFNEIDCAKIDDSTVTTITLQNDPIDKSKTEQEPEEQQQQQQRQQIQQQLPVLEEIKELSPSQEVNS